MKRLFLFIILIFLSFGVLVSQDIKIGTLTGIGKYSMADLKDLNTALMGSLPFKSKTVADFPPYLYYEPKFVLKLGKSGIGLTYSFQSTGSRVSSKDYSGEYRFDINVKSNSPGIWLEYNFRTKNKYEFYLYTSFKRNYSKIRVSEFFMVSDSLLTNNAARFSAKNYSVEPGIIIIRSFGRYSLGLNAGYTINFGKEYFRMTDKKDNYLVNPKTGYPIKPDWRGFRAGLSLYLNLKGREQGARSSSAIPS